jgi:hypothetical protein
VSEIQRENVFQIPKDDLASMVLHSKHRNHQQRCTAVLACLNETGTEANVKRNPRSKPAKEGKKYS